MAVRSAAQSPIAPGAHIVVRDAIWRVVQVDQTSTGKAAWRVVGISEIVRDQDAIFLEEYETTLGNGVEVLDPAETKLEVDTSSGHRSSLLYLESMLRDVPPTGPELHIGHRAAMDVLDFQMDPARMALAQTRSRILIADAVGLGKTLECGILLSELIRRGRGKRILVAVTKAMLTQFQKEMWARFAIPLFRLDSIGLQRIRAHIPTNHNPFYFYDKSIISIDTLAQNKAIRAHVENARWDAIVIDEAHNVAIRGGSRSLRARIAQLLSERSDHLILLSATPHDGKARSFASLMNMLDPTAIANPDEYTRDEIDGLFLRRFKRDVQDQVRKAFPERTIAKAHAKASEAEESAYQRLVDLEFSSTDKRAHGGMLFKTTLVKALFSSPAACRQTLGKRIATLSKPQHAGAFEADVEALRALDESVAAIGVQEFSKYQKLLQVIKDKKKGFGWKASKKDDRLVIFSERIETLRFLEQHLKQDLKLKDNQVALLHGGSDLDQQHIVEEFGKLESKVRLLLASDVASEGLNLHYLCHRLIHFDVPWSLMVFAQRNGRIDRYGQEQAPQIVYMLTDSETEQIHGDARILELLADRDDQATKNIGDPSALMGVYNIDDETSITAKAMEDGLDVETFDAQLGEGVAIDPLELLLGEGPGGPVASAAPKDPLSLFKTDFDFVAAALDWLAESEGVQREVRAEDGIIELKIPPDTQESRRAQLPALDLRRRFRKLPAEVVPDDGVIVLTADRARMQQEIVAARREESAWPRLHFLWPLSPVVEWCRDKARALFGRHTAPVLTLLHGLEADEAVVVVSGLLPNRQSQALVHRWFAARFRDGVLASLDDFGDFSRELKLGQKPLPNRGAPADLDALRALIAPAIDATRAAMLERRKVFERDINVKLQQELDRLEELRARQLAHLEATTAANPAKRATREREERRIHRIFDSYLTWVEAAMTSEPVPFLQVLAVLRPEGGFGEGEAT
ncbi:MAG: DEAD/DEAH box helicase [Deltaproteobacteria bacterium]|nr:DEAD/DEAH box helicase [Deltaproteobacteria bacterium]